MINLLPPNIRSSYRYAHSNTFLLKWLIAGAFGILGIVIIATLGYVYMYQTNRSLDSQISTAQSSLKKQNLEQTKKQTEDISNSVKLSVTVLSKEILFSKLLKQLAVITPSDTNLIDLNISQAQAGLDITARTTNYNAATQLQVNLVDPNNKLFQKADIISITCEASNSEDADARYPCTVVVRALFVKDNPYLFINNAGKVAS